LYFYSILFLPMILFANPIYSIYLETKSSTEALKEHINYSSTPANKFFIMKHSVGLYSSYVQKSRVRESLEIQLQQYTDIFEHAYIEKIEYPSKLIRLDLIKPSKISPVKDITGTEYYNLNISLQPIKMGELLNVSYKLLYENDKLVSSLEFFNESDVSFTDTTLYKDAKEIYTVLNLKSKDKASFKFTQQDAKKYRLTFSVNNQIYQLFLTDMINSIAQTTVYFSLGKTEIYEYSKEKIKSIKEKMKGSTRKYLVSIKASSDSIPIGGAPYKDNLDLSYLRALEVKKEMELQH